MKKNYLFFILFSFHLIFAQNTTLPAKSISETEMIDAEIKKAKASA